MSESLSEPEQRDVADILFHYRDLIDEASHGGLAPGVYTRAEGDRRSALIACVCVIGQDGQLAVRFRKVLEEVLLERPVRELTYVDCQRLATEYDKWLEVPLNGTWRSLAYDMHGLIVRDKL